MKDKLFIGHFSSDGVFINPSASAAGDLVQTQIINDLKRCKDSSKVFTLAMEPAQCWPKGPFRVKGKSINDIKFVYFINLPILKNIIFAINILLFTINNKSIKHILVYNSYFFENISVIILKYLMKANTTILIQDVRDGSKFGFLSRLQDKIANKLVFYFDRILPINQGIIDYLSLPLSKVLVFEGGVESLRIEEELNSEHELMNFAVFAGALEPHNGIDELLNCWITNKVDYTLHIFGRGSMEGMVKHFSETYDNIIFHGMKSQNIVYEYQKNAKFNFCLRLSKGLNEKLFFPSKFFNAALCSGELIVNNFYGLTEDMKNHTLVLDSNFSNIVEILHGKHDFVERKKKRLLFLEEKHCWSRLFDEIYGET